IVNAGLNFKITRSPSDSVGANHVVRQDPGSGAQVQKGSTIALVVSTGMPTVGLRDVTGYTLGDAQKDLLSDKFQVKIDRRFDPSAKDQVIAEKPKPGTKVREGSTVTLTVSDGPAPVKMPKLEGLTIDKARAIAERDGFTINVSETAAITNIPPNVIATQDIAPGTTIPADHTTAVNVVVSPGGGISQVPGIIGSDLISAQQSLQQAGFGYNIVYSINGPDSPDVGQIIAEDPKPG